MGDRNDNRGAKGSKADSVPGKAGAKRKRKGSRSGETTPEYRPGQDAEHTPAIDNAAQTKITMPPELAAVMASVGSINGWNSTPEKRRAIMEAMCHQIAKGHSLKKLCRLEGMPDNSTILKWVAEDHDLQVLYNQALMMRAESFADELIDIADKAEFATSPEQIQAFKLMVNTRQWVASRLLPKRYGDHQIVEHTGEVTMSESQVDERLNVLLKKLQIKGPKSDDDVVTV